MAKILIGEAAVDESGKEMWEEFSPEAYVASRLGKIDAIDYDQKFGFLKQVMKDEEFELNVGDMEGMPADAVDAFKEAFAQIKADLEVSKEIAEFKESEKARKKDEREKAKAEKEKAKEEQAALIQSNIPVADKALTVCSDAPDLTPLLPEGCQLDVATGRTVIPEGADPAELLAKAVQSTAVQQMLTASAGATNWLLGDLLKTYERGKGGKTWEDVITQSKISEMTDLTVNHLRIFAKISDRFDNDKRLAGLTHTHYREAHCKLPEGKEEEFMEEVMNILKEAAKGKQVNKRKVVLPAQGFVRVKIQDLQDKYGMRNRKDKPEKAAFTLFGIFAGKLKFRYAKKDDVDATALELLRDEGWSIIDARKPGMIITSEDQTEVEWLKAEEIPQPPPEGEGEGEGEEAEEGEFAEV